MSAPTQQAIQFPVPPQVFPTAFRKAKQDGTFAPMDKKYPCQACESNFTLSEFSPSEPTKKSKSWCIGYVMFGSKDPSMTEVFVAKCPSCGQPALIIPISKRKLASEIIKISQGQSQPKQSQPKQEKSMIPYKKPTTDQTAKKPAQPPATKPNGNKKP